MVPFDVTGSAADPGLIGAFLAGLISFATPCVYPLVPVTLAALGISAGTSRMRGLLLGLCYVLGISLTYTLLGLVSAHTGIVFGSFLGSPLVVSLLSIFLLLLALFSLDLISLGAISRLQTAAGRLGGAGPGGAFLMGTASGFVAAPCVGPALILILGVAAASHDAARGALLLFCYSLGFGLPFIVLGAFSGFLGRLPRSGNWLYLVKIAIATGVVAVIFFLWHGLLHDTFDAIVRALGLPGLVALAVAGGVLAGLSVHGGGGARRFVASCLLAFPIFAASLPDTIRALAPAGAQSTELEFATTIEDALARAAAGKKPVMVDLYADWCAACKELDAITFPDPAVRAMLADKFVPARINFTEPGEYSEKISETYKVVGLPTLLFLRPDGSELRELRVEGFLAPGEFIAHLEKVLEAMRQS